MQLPLKRLLPIIAQYVAENLKVGEVGMSDREKVISEIEKEIRLGEYWDEAYRTIDLQSSKSGFIFLFLRTVLSRLFFVLRSSSNYYLTLNHSNNVYFT